MVLSLSKEDRTMADKIRVCARINEEQVAFLCEPHQSLLECLRDVLGLTGTKEGCNDGNCGACSVLLDGRLVNACLVLGVEIEGREVTTVEGLADWRGLHPIQQAFVEEDALQCGYCTPGVLIAAKALLDREPDPSEERIRAWMAGNLCRCTGYDKIVRAVRSAATRLAEGGERMGATSPQGHAVIGTCPPRYEAVDKVTGRALYGPDVHLPGLLYGAVLRSPHAHARIRAIDTRRAEALPGVYGVVTAKDLPGAEDVTVRLGEGTVNFKYLCDNNLASDKVLYVGHAVAAVAANAPHVAERALGLIDVEYEVLPPVLDVLEAMRGDAPLLHEHMVTRSFTGAGRIPSNVASHFQHLKGDPERGFAEADVIVEREFRTATVHQGYIEPHAATATWGADGMLTVWTTTQGAFPVRDQLAELLRYPMSKICVVPTEVGGAFGGKATSYLETVATLLSRKTGRPVKVVMSRSEVFLATGPTSGTVIRVKMGATHAGRITAAQAELFYEAGAYPGSPVGSGAGVILAGYDIPHGRVDGYDVVVNKPKIGSYRAPGATPAVFAVEQVVDELAKGIGMDPLEFRMLNCAQEGTRRVDGPVHTHIGAYEVLKTAREHAHYCAPLTGAYRGRGVAYGYWGNWGAQSSSTISVNADGTVAMVTGSVDVTGTRTSLAMQVAGVLGLTLEQIKPSVGDTDSIGYADVSAGSRTTMATGQAVVKAARDVIAQMCERAAMLWAVPVETVSFHQGTFATSQDPARRMTFGQLAARLSETGGPVTGVGNVDVQEWGGAFGAHIVDVQVDPETGKVTILRYTAVQDVGRAIHPVQVEGQLQGGTVQGIGWALYEGYAYNQEGEMLNATLLDYKLPTALDVPPIEAVIVEVPYPKHPYGVRGVGEMPIVPPPAAIANAIYRAIGRRIEQLPMTPARILACMGVI
jgi:xanthine dehydrogenase molybdenum-binding subunit